MRLRTLIAVVAGTAVAAMLLTALVNRRDQPTIMPATDAVVASTEDSPGWDCLRRGNVTCRIDGVLVTSLEGMPSDPFGRCVFLLEISKRLDPDGVSYADTVCGPVRAQQG